MSLIHELEKELLRHRKLYYQGMPIISDIEYDQLEDELKKLNPNSYVLKMVGTVRKSGVKIKHGRKMLSLMKTYKLEELKSWIDNKEVVSTLKIDGVSCSLIYEKGILKIAKTRGDGSFGEDIYSKVLWIDSIPKYLSRELDTEIRGEIYCSQEQFFLLSDEMAAKKLERPISPRNIVAGFMGRKDKLEFCRYLNFFAFEFLPNENQLNTEWDRMNALKELGFNIPETDLLKIGEGPERILEKAKTFISNGEFQIDGAVFTYNELALHDKFGETSHHPRYKIAFKFPAEIKKTVIEGLKWSVSRNGILTPVARVSPVELSGALISRVTLHNYGIVKNFNLKKGDTIEIIRSGEVIPKFLSIVESVPGNFQIPEKCPACDGPLKEDIIRLMCLNRKCPGRNKETILNFIRKIGIDDLSSKRLEEMLIKKIVKDIPDLYKLSVEDFLKLDKVQDKLAKKLYSNIQRTKVADLKNFLAAIGIRGGAYNKCEKVVHAGFDTIEKIIHLTEEELIKIDSFAEKSTQEFYKSLKSKIPLIEKLIKLGFQINPFTLPKAKNKNKSVEGKKFCITGALSLKRSIVVNSIRQAGGIIASVVSKDLSYLVTNENESTSTKFIKAKELKIPIISEKDLEALLQNP